MLHFHWSLVENKMNYLCVVHLQHKQLSDTQVKGPNDTSFNNFL